MAAVQVRWLQDTKIEELQQKDEELRQKEQEKNTQLELLSQGLYRKVAEPGVVPEEPRNWTKRIVSCKIKTMLQEPCCRRKIIYCSSYSQSGSTHLPKGGHTHYLYIQSQ